MSEPTTELRKSIPVSPTLEDLLRAPKIPLNAPEFTIIKDCEIARDSSISLASDDDEEEETEVEEVFPCECGFNEQAALEAPETQACGASAHCINRDLFIECDPDDCPCRDRCQNQRFQRRQYANVKVVETPGKGFGLFTCEDLRGGSLVMEYVGEIINKDQMARRSEEYAASDQKHFYFMTLQSNQIIDATRRGNLSRFMNHSCGANCETQKWIVGGRIRIGLFTVRGVRAGTELTFDYKFVRYGTEPQKCLCGEATCTGFIGVSSKQPPPRSTRRKSGGQESGEEEEALEAFLAENPVQAENPAQIALIISNLHGDDGALILRLLKILAASTLPLCQRKILTSHGLKVLKGLLMDSVLAIQSATTDSEASEIISTILQILMKLPITTVNTVEDSGWMECLNSIDLHNLNNSDAPEITEQISSLKQKWTRLERVFRVERDDGQSRNTSTDVNSMQMQVPQQFSSALQRRARNIQQPQQSGPEEGGYNSRMSENARGSDYREGRWRDSEKSPRSRPVNAGSSHEPRQRPRSKSPSSRKMVPDPMWLPAQAPDGRTYYYHCETRETRWDLPMLPDAAAVAEDWSSGRGSSGGGRLRDDWVSADDRSSHHRGRDRERERDREEDYSHNYRNHHNYRSDHRASSDDRNQMTKQPQAAPQKEQLLLEGVEDSAQLAAIIERAKARRGQQSETPNSSSPPEMMGEPDVSANFTSTPSLDARMREEISGLVVRFLSHYKAALGADFKSLARKYTHRIMEKESSALSSAANTASASAAEFQLTARKRNKIKLYLAEIVKSRGISLVPEHEQLLNAA